jgi:hypothetical protein
MVNVPTAVWINESGKIVRPTEPAGWSDAWRRKDQDELERIKNLYLDTLRDWVEQGDSSPYIVPAEEIRQRMSGPTDEHALATSHYRMGLYLTELGYKDDAKKHFSEAINLRTESWNFKRQSWSLVETKEVGRDKFIEALENLGAQRYYPEIRLKGKI